MYNNILIEYLFLINLIKSEIVLNKNLFYSLQGISTNNHILLKELSYCENQIKDFIQSYMNINSEIFYNNKMDLYFQSENLKINNNYKVYNFSFNNEIFFLKNISLLNEKLYTLNELLEKKINYKIHNNIFFKNLDKKYYLIFLKNDYFNFTKIINFIFNIDLIKILENKNNINILKNSKLNNLNSYKNINKNIVNKFNPIRVNNKNIYLKFYKNINYFDYLDLKKNDLDLVKNHFYILSNLYTTEYNFKILLNFFKTDNHKEFYFKLPINYITSNICSNLLKSCYKDSPSIDYYLNNLLYDKIIYNQNGKDIKESLIFIKKRINNTPLIFNYKFKNKFNYFSNKKYNININELKDYNLDFFNVSKTKKMVEEKLDLNFFYYARNNIQSEVSRASSLIKYNLPRIRPFIIKYSKKRQHMYDTKIFRMADLPFDVTNIYHTLTYNHYLYGFFKGGVSSLINFTQIDMFHNNCDIFFFKGDTFNKQHHHISSLNKIAVMKKRGGIIPVDFFWESKYRSPGFFRNNLIYEKTKYERSLNLMFNFNEELKSNNTLTEYICNLLFGFIKDNNETYITFKDHYNKNNFIGKHILYRINNFIYNKDIKFNIFYREYLNIRQGKSWQKPFYFEKIKEIPYYLHTKKNYVYPNYTVWPISEDFIIRYYSKRGYRLNYRHVYNYYNFISDSMIIPYSRFLKTNIISKSIYNKYYNYLPFLYYINNFDFIKKSINYQKRNDFISFIPKFKIFNFKFFDSIENFQYFEKLNSILIKFNDNLYNNNNQKLDQSLYNLNNFNSKIINYIPEQFYEKYATLEWNNKLFFNILNRKLFYKHLISFGDLSNNFIQNLIYDYAKTIFFEEKLNNIFFNRNVFKYKNFENLNDFIKFKVNNITLKNENFINNKNRNFNFIEDFQTMKKILIAPYLHMKKHYDIYFQGEDRYKILKWYKYNMSWYIKEYDSLKEKYEKFKLEFPTQENLKRKDVRHHYNFDTRYDLEFYVDRHPDKFTRQLSFKDFDDYYNEFLIRRGRCGMHHFEMKSLYGTHRYRTAPELPDTFHCRSIYNNFNFFRLLWNGEWLFSFIRPYYLKYKLHIASVMPLPAYNTREECHRFHSRYSRKHMVNFNFFFYQIPSNYLYYLFINKMNHSIIFDKIFNLLLISNLKILSYFQRIDNIYNLDKNFNFFKFLKSEVSIKDINLIKKTSITNYKLYKNKLIEESGLYNINILKKGNKEDENYFLLFNRKRLDNELIYKSWHSTKFLNKKIEYHSKESNFFNFEKKFIVFTRSPIFNILRIRSIKELYVKNYLTTSVYNFFSTDLIFNRTTFHKMSSNLFIRNINFNYPQDNISNIKVFPFFTYIKEKMGFNLSERELDGSLRKYYLKKRMDIKHERFYGNKGILKYGARAQYNFHKTFILDYYHSMNFYHYIPYDTSTEFKIDSFKSNIISKKKLIKQSQFHNINKFLSYFQYYGDTRYPKKKKNFKKLNFIFNIYNFQSYFINDRYSFENKNLISLKQYYNHRTSSDYLRNLINQKKRINSADFYLSLTNNRKNNLTITSKKYNLYNLYTPIKIWEIKLSNKLFPYFYSKNLNTNYQIIRKTRLLKYYDNINVKRSNKIFRNTKIKPKILEYFRYYKHDILTTKFLNFEERKDFFYFLKNNIFNNTKRDNQIKKKLYINSVGNLINVEYLYRNYILKKNLYLENEKFINSFTFKINNDASYSYYYKNFDNKLPNHLNYKLLFDVYNYDEEKKFFIDKSLKVFTYCVKNNFYVKIPYITVSYSKNLYEFFHEKKIKFFKLRTFMKLTSKGYNNPGFLYFVVCVKPYFTNKPQGEYFINNLDKNMSFNFYKNNELKLSEIFSIKTIYNFEQLKIEKLILYFKFIHNKNLANVSYINLYKGNLKYMNDNFKLINGFNNNYFFFSKTFEFNKYILKKKKNLISYSFFNPYDFFIFRYKSSFTSLNNVFYKNNSKLNLRNFIYNLFKFGENRSKSFDLFYKLLDKDFSKILNKEFIFNHQKRLAARTKYCNYIFKFNKFFKRYSFTLKYYENISDFNKKKLEELSFFGFLLKNNIIMGIYEYNNLYNLSYNFKFEKFYINNNEMNIYSINKLLNTIFILKNKYIWLIFSYYNNLFYFILNAKEVLQDFLLKPSKFWSNYFYLRIPIIFSLNYKLLLIDIILTLYTILIQILIIFYSWFCISGEGLINLNDYIIFNHDKLDWVLLFEKYNLYPCDLYGRSLFEMQISRIIYILFFISYFIIYIKIIFLIFKSLSSFYNLFLLNLNRKKNYFFINNKFDLEINNKIHSYYLNYDKFLNNFIFIKNNLEIVFFFKSKHSYKYYKSKFKCKLKLPYFLDEASLRRINKMKILTNFETHYYILDPDLRKLRTTLSFLNASYALFTKTRTIEIGNLIIKGNIKRILYIHQLGNLITYDPILGRFLMPNSMDNLEKKDIYIMDKLFLNNQLKIFNLMPLSEEKDYVYIPKFIFKNLIKYKFKYINVYYTYNFLFFFTFDSLLTIEGTLFRISSPNFFKPLIFFNQNMPLRSFPFFI